MTWLEITRVTHSHRVGTKIDSPSSAIINQILFIEEALHNCALSYQLGINPEPPGVGQRCLAQLSHSQFVLIRNTYTGIIPDFHLGTSGSNFYQE